MFWINSICRNRLLTYRNLTIIFLWVLSHPGWKIHEFQWGYAIVISGGIRQNYEFITFGVLILKEKVSSGSDIMVVYSYRSCELKTCLSLYYHDQFINWCSEEKTRLHPYKITDKLLYTISLPMKSIKKAILFSYTLNYV